MFLGGVRALLSAQGSSLLCRGIALVKGQHVSVQPTAQVVSQFAKIERIRFVLGDPVIQLRQELPMFRDMRINLGKPLFAHEMLFSEEMIARIPDGLIHEGMALRRRHRSARAFYRQKTGTEVKQITVLLIERRIPNAELVGPFERCFTHRGILIQGK